MRDGPEREKIQQHSETCLSGRDRAVVAETEGDEHGRRRESVGTWLRRD